MRFSSRTEWCSPQRGRVGSSNKQTHQAELAHRGHPSIPHREHGIDLPRFTVGPVHPDFVLDRKTTRRLLFGGGDKAFRCQSGLCRCNLVGRLDLDTEMVERTGRLLSIFNQDQLERWIGNGEVR